MANKYLNKIICADSGEYLKRLPADSIDAVVTDPPYGLGVNYDPVKVLRAWLDGKDFEPTQRGFNGNEWDAFVPQPNFWREVYRVLRAGGYVLAFGSTTMYDYTTMALRCAGFEIRDTLQWLHGNGFPKSKDLRKTAERGGVDSQRFEGKGTALRPAHEPIIAARKPLTGTYMQHLNEHATGILNIDPCRTEQGRFPTNVLHDGSTEVLADFEQYGYKRRSNATEKLLMAESAKEGVFSRLRKGGCKTTLYNDAGSVVRYFYCAKPSVAERHNGVVGGNPHHTVKPIALMRWLVRLVTPENGTILDPYAGSGTTCIAAMQGGFKYLGIEINSEYVSIAAQRLKFYEQHFGRGCHGQMGLFA